MKYIKTIVSLSACSMMATAIAGHPGTFKYPKAVQSLQTGGLYMGIQGGVNSLNVERNAVTPIDTLLGTVIIDHKNDDGNTDLAGGLFAGYEQPISGMSFISAELDANYDTTRVKGKINNPGGFTGNNVKLRQKLKQDYSFALLPGYKSQYGKLYLKFGIHRGEFDVATSGTTSFNISTPGSYSKWLTGYSAGLGISQHLAKHLDLRLEYNYTDYDKMKKTALDNFTQQTTSTTYEPVGSAVMLGLVYSPALFG